MTTLPKMNNYSENYHGNLNGFAKNISHIKVVSEFDTLSNELYVFLQYSHFSQKDEVAIIEILENCLIIPGKFYPLKTEECFEESSQYETNLQGNKQLTEKCLLLFMNFFCYETNGWDKIKIDVVGSSFQKKVLKKLGGKLLISLASNLGNYRWSNETLRKLSKTVISYIKAIAHVKKVTTLLSGVEEISLEWFPDGLFVAILNEMRPYFQKDSWKEILYLKHVLIWSITKVKFPYLGQHIQLLVPFLLKIIDDFRPHNKCLGISTMEFVIDNVSPSELCTWNHADVIYDVLYKQFYSSNDDIYKVTLDCMFKILKVLSKEYTKEVKYSKWDEVFEKILNSIEFTNKSSTKEIFLKAVTKYISYISVGIFKHLKHIITVVSYTLNYSSEVCRSLTLNLLKDTIVNGWPCIHRYQNQILKSLLKIINELLLSDIDTFTSEGKSKLISQAVEILILMQNCCGEVFVNKLRQVVEAKIEGQASEVQHVVNLSLK